MHKTPVGSTRSHEACGRPTFCLRPVGNPDGLRGAFATQFSVDVGQHAKLSDFSAGRRITLHRASDAAAVHDDALHVRRRLNVNTVATQHIYNADNLDYVRY